MAKMVQFAKLTQLGKLSKLISFGMKEKRKQQKKENKKKLEELKRQKKKIAKGINELQAMIEKAKEKKSKYKAARKKLEAKKKEKAKLAVYQALFTKDSSKGKRRRDGYDPEGDEMRKKDDELYKKQKKNKLQLEKATKELEKLKKMEKKNSKAEAQLKEQIKQAKEKPKKDPIKAFVKTLSKLKEQGADVEAVKRDKENKALLDQLRTTGKAKPKITPIPAPKAMEEKSKRRLKAHGFANLVNRLEAAGWTDPAQWAQLTSIDLAEMNIEAEERVKFTAKFGTSDLPPSMRINKPAVPSFEVYCKKLRKRKFFRSFQPGSDEHVERMRQAKALYKENFGVEAGIISAEKPTKKRKRKKEVTEFQVDFARNKDAPWNFAAMRDFPVRVETVRDGGQAFDAGVEPGDHIISVDGVDVNEDNYMKVFKTLRSGNACKIVFRRIKVTAITKKTSDTVPEPEGTPPLEAPPPPATEAPAPTDADADADDEPPAKKQKTNNTAKLEAKLGKIQEENLRLKALQSMDEAAETDDKSGEPAPKKRELVPARPPAKKTSIIVLKRKFCF